VLMELLMASRNDAELAKVLRPHLISSESATDDWWCEYLDMLRWPRPRLIALRSVAVACIRGLSLDYLVHRNNKVHENAVVLMREMFLAIAKK
jgi:hypothetical protein